MMHGIRWYINRETGFPFPVWIEARLLRRPVFIKAPPRYVVRAMMIQPGDTSPHYLSPPDDAWPFADDYESLEAGERAINAVMERMFEAPAAADRFYASIIACNFCRGYTAEVEPMPAPAAKSVRQSSPSSPNKGSTGENWFDEEG